MNKAQKDRAKERNRVWANKNRSKLKAHYESKKEHYQLCERDRQYRKMYGFSVSEYDGLFIAQDGKCKMCGSDKSGSKTKVFVVDHCHATGKIRGLLCVKCNVAVGFIEKHLERALKYLSGEQ